MCTLLALLTQYISQLHNASFGDLSNLTFLELSYNSTKSIEKGFFGKLNKLETLLLSYNLNIILYHLSLTPSSFEELWNLKSLYFQHIYC